MGDLQTPWNPGSFSGNQSEPVMRPDSADLSGDLIAARGGDPNITEGQKESSNSMSGLPPLPSRLVSSDAPPAPPSLEDRMPGTIDQK